MYYFWNLSDAFQVQNVLFYLVSCHLNLCLLHCTSESLLSKEVPLVISPSVPWRVAMIHNNNWMSKSYLGKSYLKSRNLITSCGGGCLWAVPHCLQSQHNRGPPVQNLACWELWPCSTSRDPCMEPPQCLPSRQSPPHVPKKQNAKNLQLNSTEMYEVRYDAFTFCYWKGILQFLSAIQTALPF